MLWITVIILLPLALPVLAMLCLKLFPGFSTTADWLTPVKDGQLCWGAISMAFSGMYAMLYPAQGVELARDTLSVGIFGFSILLLFSALIAAVGAVAPTATGVPSGKAWYKHYPSLAASLVLTTVAAVGYTVVHFNTNV